MFAFITIENFFCVFARNAVFHFRTCQRVSIISAEMAAGGAVEARYISFIVHFIS